MKEENKSTLERKNDNRSNSLRILENATGKTLTSGAINAYSVDGNLDIVFAFDTTGSMYKYLEEVQKILNEIVQEIKGAIPNIALGIIAYGDYCDKDTTYVTKVLDLVKDVEQVKKFIYGIERTNGGDLPEALEVALQDATTLRWRPFSSKAMVVISDAPPHGVTDKMLFQNDYKRETLNLKGLEVKIHTVQCGNDGPTERTFKWLSETTGGVYMNLKNIKDLKTILIGACMKEVGLLDKYIGKLQENKELSETKRTVLTQLQGKL